jgi:hypothetical protein
MASMLLCSWGPPTFDGAIDSGPADGENFHELGDGVLACGMHAGKLGLLAASQLGLLALKPALGAGDGHALAGPEPDQVNFEFGESGQNVKEHLANRVARVVDSATQYYSPGLLHEGLLSASWS